MCGGGLEFEQGTTVGICDSCGTKQTLPRLDDDRRANLYDRANHFRRNNEFDKAMGIYEQILNEDNTDAEAYWSLVLCRYGIEYVEDPATNKHIPTVNRAQFTSIYMDEDYKSALRYSDGYQKQIYEEEAKAIDDIQKGILAISSKEEPFDVFICYKETDNNGRRTMDSVLANDLYHQLKNEGFKVFFSRITLEDKLGTAYEPYIFAALNSAKVMVVLGTKPEYFNAVWVKNEWSRYLALVKDSKGKKVLIPVYRDMDPYDLPEEFSHLQAQDMSKLGFMQDLIRGIKKITEADKPKAAAKETVAAHNPAHSNAAPLLKRAFIFLEDGNWREANEYFEKVLDMEPENAKAYLGKLMAEIKVSKQENLKDCAQPFEDNGNYQKILRFGDDALKEELSGYITYIKERNENDRLTEKYNSAVKAMETATSEEAFKSAAGVFKSISGFKDADTLYEQCLEKAEVSRKDAIYNNAKSQMKGEKIEEIINYEAAIRKLQSISGWKDADEQISVCQRKIEEIKAKEEADRLKAERILEERRIAKERQLKKIKRVIVIATPIVCACVVFLIVLKTVIIPSSEYNSAITLMNDGKIVEAYDSLIALNGYKDSTEKAASIYSQYIVEKMKYVKVGDTVVFGAYEQDNDKSNGKEDIEWIVLAKEDNKLLVISDKALDCKQYNLSYEDITWEECTLRTWMNDTFLKSAFSADEQAKIQSTNVSADKNTDHNINAGNATTDKVFLLSIKEVKEYFISDEARKCVPTAYAEANGAYKSRCYTKGGTATCSWWWLRSPGYNQHYAAGVGGAGLVNSDNGCGVSYGNGCVRPAMWINLDS
jgi:tetratricopeptide (TPR) repeat protein